MNDAEGLGSAFLTGQLPIDERYARLHGTFGALKAEPDGVAWVESRPDKAHWPLLLYISVADPLLRKRMPSRKLCDEMLNGTLSVSTLPRILSTDSNWLTVCCAPGISKGESGNLSAKRRH